MTALAVHQAAATDVGRLYPRYDEDAKILVITSRMRRPWPYGISIDGMLICDLDETKVLANVDLHYDRTRWPRGEEVRWPPTAEPADLVFEVQAPSQSMSTPVAVLADRSASIVRIRIGNSAPDSAVMLSDDCVAELGAGELVGFVVRLVR